MNILAVSKDYVFGVNCINGISNITRCSKTDPTDTLTKEFKAVYISDMFAVNEKLYAIIAVNGENKTLFAEISIATLSIVEEYDITRYGLPCNIIEYDGKVYLANQYDDAIEGPVSTTLTVFDINKKTFEVLRHTRAEPTRPKSFIFPILGRFSPCNTESIAASKKHPITEKLKLFGCFAVLRCQIFVVTRKKTKQCCRIARLFDEVTAKRGRFKTVSVRLSYAWS